MAAADPILPALTLGVTWFAEESTEVVVTGAYSVEKTGPWGVDETVVSACGAEREDALGPRGARVSVALALIVSSPIRPRAGCAKD